MGGRLASGGPPRSAVPSPSPETFKQSYRRLDGVWSRCLEPIERSGIRAPFDDVENHARQINTMNVWFPMRPKAIVRFPKPVHDARTSSACAAGSLICGILRDALDRKAVDCPRRVVPGHLLKAGIDNRRHARNCHGGLRDIGRDDHSSRPGGRRREGAILLSRIQRAIECQDLDIGLDTPANVGDRLLNFERARKRKHSTSPGERLRSARTVRTATVGVTGARGVGRRKRERWEIARKAATRAASIVAGHDIDS